ATIKSFKATGVDLNIAGQTMNGDFSFEQTGVGANQQITITAEHVNISLGGTGTSAPVRVVDAGGTLQMKNGGVAGVINGAVILSFPGVEFSPGFKVTINTNTAEGTLPGVPDPLPAGPYLKVEAGTDAAPATMTIAGQTLSGKFAFEQYTVAGTGDRRPRQHRRLPAATRT